MNSEIHTIPNFDRNVKKLSKKYRSLKGDIMNLVSEIKNNPYIGTDIGNSVHKYAWL